MVFSVRLEDELLDRLDQWRMVYMPLRSRSAAFRELLKRALDIEEDNYEHPY